MITDSQNEKEKAMTISEAITARHSVRQYTEASIPDDIVAALNNKINEINAQRNLHIQLVTNEPKAFDGTMAHYGNFSGVSNYFALIGKNATDLDEKCGYYGEALVLLAQSLGLNTCWVALTFKKIKTAYCLDNGEKLVMVIALGYGKSQGVAHKSKPLNAVGSCAGDMPDWFRKGVEAALLAPTAMNQQKFRFILNGDRLSAKPGIGFYTKVDLGIAKLHFEIGAERKFFTM